MLGDSERLLSSAMAMTRVSALLNEALDSRLQAECGLTIAEKEVLIQLEANDGYMMMREIAEQLLLSGGGVTKMIDRLESEGLVGREASPDDRRVVFAVITDDGKRMVERVQDIMLDEITTRWSSKLDSSDADAVLRTAAKVLRGNEDWA